MKYGKEFQSILESSSFPDDWKHSAIEYRKLKKLIKNVVLELEGMGLSPDVLERLLVTDGSSPRGDSPARRSSRTGSSNAGTPAVDGDFDFEFEFEDPSDGAANGAEAEFRVEEIEPEHRFRVRMRNRDDSPARGAAAHSFSAAASSAGTPAVGSPAPISVSDIMMQRTPSAASSADHRPRVRRGVKAEYVLNGDENPVPQIRLRVSELDSESDPLFSASPATTTSELPSDTDDEEEDDSSRDGNGRPAAIPPSPQLRRIAAVASPIWAIASGAEKGMRELSLGEAHDEDADATPTMRPRPQPAPPLAELGAPSLGRISEISSSTSPSTIRGLPTPANITDLPTTGATITEIPARPGSVASEVGIRGVAQPPPGSSPGGSEYIIPLEADVRFFEVLTAALQSLSEFHKEQQELFNAAVQRLCAMVSASIQPSGEAIDLPTPPNQMSDPKPYVYHSTHPKQKDLYAWRTIFAMWVESEIFESSSERDRGERSVDEAERRLQSFANAVVKRGLGDRRTLRGKRTRKAWDEFLRLNVLLLDLKRFQTANIEAARKILKKHDKRTALSAGSLVPLSSPSSWTFYSTSLPHVLLTSLTETLLPILPSLDDYACLICMSIAFKPIRLSCGHLFCVRCLVKMQQRGNNNCPLCRKETVLVADKTNLDSHLMNFMKDWFPKEVREKQNENAREIALESIEDAGLDTRCTVM